MNQNNRSRGLIPLHGPDDTFNLNPMLLQNISMSPYFRKCCNITDWNALVDEIYYEVKHVEPWSPGTFATFVNMPAMDAVRIPLTFF